MRQNPRKLNLWCSLLPKPLPSPAFLSQLIGLLYLSIRAGQLGVAFNPFFSPHWYRPPHVFSVLCPEISVFYLTVSVPALASFLLWPLLAVLPSSSLPLFQSIPYVDGQVIVLEIQTDHVTQGCELPNFLHVHRICSKFLCFGISFCLVFPPNLLPFSITAVWSRHTRLLSLPREGQAVSYSCIYVYASLWFWKALVLKVGVGTSRDITWELIRNANFWIPPRLTESEILEMGLGRLGFNHRWFQCKVSLRTSTVKDPPLALWFPLNYRCQLCEASLVTLGGVPLSELLKLAY